MFESGFSLVVGIDKDPLKRWKWIWFCVTFESNLITDENVSLIQGGIQTGDFNIDVFWPIVHG